MAVMLDRTGLLLCSGKLESSYFDRMPVDIDPGSGSNSWGVAVSLFFYA
jgi:hypothetical protein